MHKRVHLHQMQQSSALIAKLMQLCKKRRKTPVTLFISSPSHFTLTSSFTMTNFEQFQLTCNHYKYIFYFTARKKKQAAACTDSGALQNVVLSIIINFASEAHSQSSGNRYENKYIIA